MGSALFLAVDGGDGDPSLLPPYMHEPELPPAPPPPVWVGDTDFAQLEYNPDPGPLDLGGYTPSPAPPATSSPAPPVPIATDDFPDPSTWQGSYINAYDVQTYIELGYPAAEVLAWQRAVNISLAARGVPGPASHVDPGGTTPQVAESADGGSDGAVRETQSAYTDERRPAGFQGQWRNLVDVFKITVPAKSHAVDSLASSLVEVFK